ncbi:SGNH/GDSL hydrolase family protein [Neobacillus pocheonensis]|uniref:SGNH/GDSL hydrolase family protein n=1 Tax=Neobacillus pocheonensis TaxID=363869 RepID=UPI003D2E0CB8
MKKIKKLSSMLLAVALVAVLPLSASAKENEKKPFDYLALGDSLAAGITPFGQDGLGYPDYLKARFEQSQYSVHLTNLGVSGYTSTHLLLDVANNPTTKQVIRNSELITIDIGANDLIGALLTNPALLGAAVTNVKNNLNGTLQAIKLINPNANVYVMGYYNPLPHLPEQQQATLLPFLNGLNDAIKADAAANGYTFVPTEKIIAKKADQYLPNPQDIHLSEEGYQIVAKEFWKAIED